MSVVTVRGAGLLGPPTQSTRQLRRRIQIFLTTLLILTNVIGAGIVLMLRAWVLPGGGLTGSHALAIAIAVPVYVVSAVAIGVIAGTLAAIRPLRWVLDDRRPTERERRTALRLSARLTAIQVVLWGIAVVIFATLASFTQPEATFSAGVSVAIAGIVVCTIAYLITEYAFRPIAGRALADGNPSALHGSGLLRRMVIFWLLGTAAPTLGIFIACTEVINGEDMTRTQFAVLILCLASIVLIFGLLVTVLDGRAVTRPVVALRTAIDQIRDGNYNTRVIVDDNSEIGQLQVGFNQMAAGLREREEIRDLFGRHVGRDVASSASTDDQLGGISQTLSTLMVDMTGSTSYAANRDPNEVVEVLNRYFAVIVEEVTGNGGLVNKFMGDAALAIFGAPRTLEDHAGSSLRAAQAIAKRLRTEVPEIEVGIGVSTGEVVAGNIGHESRFEYTVIGDAVNSAARLTELAKGVPGNVLTTWRTVEESLGEQWRNWVMHAQPVLRGRTEPTTVGRLVHVPQTEPSQVGR